MRTVVVHINDEDGYDCYIGRAGKGFDGYFGNPIRQLDECPECEGIHTSRGATLKCYRTYFIRRLEEDSEFARRVAELAGKRLGCFCRPHNPCHGDIIAEYLNEQSA